MLQACVVTSLFRHTGYLSIDPTNNNKKTNNHHQQQQEDKEEGE